MTITFGSDVPARERIATAALLSAWDSGITPEITATWCEVLALVLAAGDDVPVAILLYLHGAAVISRIGQKLRERDERRIAEAFALEVSARGRAGKETN